MNIKKPMEDVMVSNGDQTVADKERAAPILSPGKHGEAANYDWMGPSLRRMYDDVLNEPVPDSFVELLKQLHDRQNKR
jgi:hypothetical protein